ncbi:MAG TPA: Crp/Fnr family transcriptional regulator [Chitinophagales bacterium]|nr:Crp/Fnr family transcriptional regulator [Chitinophagales bacterium]
MNGNAENQLTKLQRFLDSVNTLSDDDRMAFMAIWQPYNAKRKEILTRAGEKEKYLYFINEGVQRIYYAEDTGRESTILFTYEPTFGGVLDSFMQQKPSRYFYETLTPSSFIRATYKDLDTLMRSHPAIEVMVRDGITESLSGILERVVELQCFSSEEKYRKMLSRSPHMLQLVPHKYLANYLGIDATNFSKLINRVKI